MSDAVPLPRSTTTGHIGAAGEAAVTAALLRAGFDVARPFPDRGVDLVVLSPDLTRAVPVQVKTATSRALGFARKWFAPIDVVLVYVWLLPGETRFFVFDGITGVEDFLGASAAQPSWSAKGRWIISTVGVGQEARLQPFENAWASIRRRQNASLPSPQPVDFAAAPLLLTRHVQERIEAGEVALRWIEATLAAPQRIAPDPRRPGVTLSWRPIAEFGDRILRVAHRPGDGHIVVITALFDRGALP